MAAIPPQLRPAVAHELDRLVRGELPGLLHWVENYHANGAALIAQPSAIWEHPQADAVQTPDGGWHVIVPLFTESKSPSDLSAEVVVDPEGVASIHDVHVL